ncbi:MAG: hypothetical protein PVJ84_01245 [Desulfobacteraceae bacterium]|jgi:hypothetical protein
MISTANFHETAPSRRPCQFTLVGIVFTLFSFHAMAVVKIAQSHHNPMINNIATNPAVTRIIDTPMSRRFIAVMIIKIEDGRPVYRTASAIPYKFVTPGR